MGNLIHGDVENIAAEGGNYSEDKWHVILTDHCIIFFREGCYIFTLNKCRKLRRYPRQPDPDNAGVDMLKKESRASA